MIVNMQCSFHVYDTVIQQVQMSLSACHDELPPLILVTYYFNNRGYNKCISISSRISARCHESPQMSEDKELPGGKGENISSGKFPHNWVITGK